MTNKKKLFLNILASYAFEFVSIISGFIIPRLMLVAYGSDVNGLVSSITQFLGFISFLEAGIGAVIKANLYKPLACKDSIALSRVLKSARNFFRVIAIILLIYTAVLIVVYPSIVSSNFDFVFVASLIIIISASSFAQYFFGITNQILLNADKLVYVQLFITIIAVLLNTVLSWGLITMGCSIHIVKLSTAIIFILKPIALDLFVKRNYVIDYTIRLSDEPIKQKWNGMAQHMATIVQDNANIIILTVFSTLSNVSIYAVYCLVTNGVKQLVTTISLGVSPIIGELIAKNEKLELNNIFSYYEWSTHILSTFLFSITSVLIVPFVMVYTLGVEDANYCVPLFATLLCITAALRCIQQCYNVVVQSAGHFKQTQNAAIIEPVINLILSVFLVKSYGLIGVTIAMIVSLFYRMLYLVYYLRRQILNRTFRSFIYQMFVDIINISSIVSFGSLYTSTQNCDGYIDWIIMAIVVFCIAFIITSVVNILFFRDNCRIVLNLIIRKFYAK